MSAVLPAGSSAATQGDVASRQRMRILISSYVGSVIEWFDFYLYGIGAASIFSVLFFPSHNPMISMMASLGTLAVAYVVRPIGGIIYGYFGDRVGRKKMLVSSIVLMGLSTVLVGVLPTYAQVGALAPILLILLRIVQGLAVAGEWGGAVLMTLEHAHPRRRGLWSTFVGMGISSGILLASGCFALLARLPQASFLSWGWRLPFLLATVLVLLGLWLRLGVEESPVFLEAQRNRARGGARRPPLIEVFRTHFREILLAFFMTVGPFALSGVKGAFLVAYAIKLGLPRATVLDAATVSSFVSVIAMLIGGFVSDIFGRRPVVIVGGALLIGASVLIFELLNRHSGQAFMLGMCLIMLAHGIMYGPIGAFTAELFPTTTRFTGASLAYQAAGVIGGGFAPAIAAALLAAGGGVGHVQYVLGFMILCCVLGMVAAILSRETYRVSLTAARAGDDDTAIVPEGLAAPTGMGRP